MTKTDFRKKIFGNACDSQQETEINQRKNILNIVTSVIHSQNQYIEDYFNMDFKDFCSQADNNNLYYSILSFRDDYCSFMNAYPALKTLKAIAVLASEILASPEKYTDYESRDAYQAYIDTDGMAGSPFDNSEKLIEESEFILSQILFLPYKYYLH